MYLPLLKEICLRYFNGCLYAWSQANGIFYGIEYHYLGKSQSPLFSSSDFYHHLVGRLIYFTTIRPNFAYSVYILAPFMYQP